MKQHYDFSKGTRGAVLPGKPEPEGKVCITIRPDQDIVERFLAMTESSGGENGYQTSMDAARREYLDAKAPEV